VKRSSVILLGATGILVAGTWLGRSSGPLGHGDVQASIYDDVNACIAANILSRERCEEEFRTASDRHLTEAPRFDRAQACEAQYGEGQCRPATIAGTQYFIPAMVGFLVAQQLASRRTQVLLPPLASQQPCAPGYSPETQPGCVMRSSNSSWRSYSTTGGASVSRDTTSRRPISTTVPRSTISVLPRTSGGTVAGSAPGSTRTSPSSSVSRGGFGSTARSTSTHSSS
jgi:uncharacterized protein YgiB involved in biofilm formation